MSKEINDSTAITHTLPNTLLMFYMALARKKGHKNAQSLINEVLRDYKNAYQKETGFRPDL